jgi:rhodanese-related sulfurtransferase
VPDGSAIDRLLAEARSGLDRVDPIHLSDELAAGALVVDIRPEASRRAEGELPGAIVVERIHLEWRLDPTSADRLPDATPDRRVIVMCDEGYASSLAAATLRDLGVKRATDLAGGYRAWRAQHP